MSRSIAGDTICPTGLFRCPEGTCIEYSRVCNYQRDCEKGEDEFQNCQLIFRVTQPYTMLPVVRLTTLTTGSMVYGCVTLKMSSG
ncbi:hypothetical protein MSG28_004893 [Choristoneura fumiferana]|uniref:Uncharacterized protein n=1 Tax=Choristoneura fumiferana TaxID=7141 RepID=A0ACC0JNY5_CHOFU|nr:hypothetical protein MSG28_004893 [Choristoneura fumiferana]